MDKFKEAISKKKIAIDILLENKTNIAIEWFSNKNIDDFVDLETYKNHVSGLCFKYLDNKYEISKGCLETEDDKYLQLNFNDKIVLYIHYIEKYEDEKICNKFDWNGDNSIQELRLYDWVEELPIIMNNEIDKAKIKRTRSQIQKEKEEKEERKMERLNYIHFVDNHFSLGKYADIKSKDYKDYIAFNKQNEEDEIFDFFK
jgi:hypothetical protein